MRKLALRKWLVVVAMFASATLADSQPRPFVSRYLKTTGAGFSMSVADGVQYALSFNVREPFERPVYVLVVFENPKKGGAPLEKVVVLEPGARELRVQSDRLVTIRNDKTYLVQVFLYADEARSRAIGMHEQRVLFSVPWQLLKQLENDYAVKID